MLSRIGVALAATAALILIVVPAASAATLKAPATHAPAAGAVVETVPSFTWRSVRRAAEYEFQVAADKGFGSIVDKGSFRTRNTAATLKTSLANGTYFWRVRGITASDKAGRWSPPRSFEKAWVRTPALLEPSDALAMTWPIRPLVLRWTSVPHATKYQVTIASDPGLAHPVIGTPTKPVETQGTVYALPGSLASGTYYWAVTPVDEGKFKGRRSRVGSFSWGWPTRSSGRVLDLDPAAEVFDPLLQWDPVPGASAYEVEVNPTAEFTPGSKAFGGVANGTSIAPTVHLLNNTYHWRVRAIDPDGNPGVWNEGPVFKKEFDDVTPTVPNIRMRDHRGADLAAASTTPEPFFTWSPVPGASRYELQFAPYAGYCDWSSALRRQPAPAGEPAELDLHGDPGLGGGLGAAERQPRLGHLAEHGVPLRPLHGRSGVLHADPRPGRSRQRERVDLRQRRAADQPAPSGLHLPAGHQDGVVRDADAAGRLSGAGARHRHVADAVLHVGSRSRRGQLLRRGRQGRGVHRGRGRPLHPRVDLRAVQAVPGRDHVLLLEGDPGRAGQRTRLVLTPRGFPHVPEAVAAARAHRARRRRERAAAAGVPLDLGRVRRHVSAAGRLRSRFQAAARRREDGSDRVREHQGLSRRHAALLARPREHANARRVAQLVADPLLPAPAAGAGDRRQPRRRRDDPGARVAPGPGRGLLRHARRPGRRHRARLQHALDALHADAVLRHRHLALEGARQLPREGPGRLLGVAGVRAPPQRPPGRQGRPRARPDAVHVEPGPGGHELPPADLHERQLRTGLGRRDGRRRR